MAVITSFGDASAQPNVNAATCTRCAACVEVCASYVLSKTDDAIAINTSAGFGCIGCAQCAMVCPTGSITVSGRRTTPADLVPLPTRDRWPTPEQLEALLISRRSVRQFKLQEVSREVVERVLSVAATAPMGIPPWDVGVTVFLGRAKVQALAADIVELYGKMAKVLDNAVVPALLRPFMKRHTHRQLKSFILPLAKSLAAHRARGEDFLLYDAPCALLFHASPYADAADPIIACTYAMIAAESLGLGSCMIGCLAPPMERRPRLLTKFRIPAGQLPKIVLVLGYPVYTYQRAVKRPFHSVTYF
jgi:Fe-S-cluster-containing hydrogenase component 2